MSAPSWKDRVSGEMSPEMIAEIDAFEGQIDLKKQGKLDDKFFAAHLLETTWGIIDGAAATVGVAFSRGLPFSHPGFASRLEVD